MPFTLPQFNLLCNVWSAGTGPPAIPRVANLPCQLYTNSRVALVFESDVFGSTEIGTFLRCPWGSDVEEGDYIELPTLPAPMNWWYADDPLPVHAGFVNQYYVAHLVNTDGLVPPPPHFFVLMEGSGYVLMEDGVSRIGLE
jgi:hypothetical protein